MDWLKAICVAALVVIIICLFACRPQKGSLADKDGVDPEVVNFVLNQTPNGISVDLCEYMGKKLLLVNVGCCDYMAAVYDLNGRLIGYPFGGITGKGDQSFLDWFAYARTIRRLKTK